MMSAMGLYAVDPVSATYSCLRRCSIACGFGSAPDADASFLFSAKCKKIGDPLTAVLIWGHLLR
jgi:hypothetical protein